MRIFRAGLVAALVFTARLTPLVLVPAHVTAQVALPPSALIVDDRNPGFSMFGPPTGWHIATSTTNDYFLGSMTWTNNVLSTTTNENYARWSLPVTATVPLTYEVFAFVPRYNSSSQAARYVIHTGGITATRVVNQNNYFSEWVSLGSYGFVSSTTSARFVELGDGTGEVSGTVRIGFDALAFVPQLPVTPTPPQPVSTAGPTGVPTAAPTGGAMPSPTPVPRFTPASRIALPLAMRNVSGTVPPTPTPMPTVTPIPSSATTSRYIQTTDPQRHYRMGCEAGARAEHGIVILSFGQPVLLTDTLSYGVLIYGVLFPAPMSQISDAAKGFIQGYAQCLPAGSTSTIQIGLGINNFQGETSTGHGKAWAQMVNSVDDWLHTSAYASRVSIAAAADLEPGFNTASNTRAWFAGYMTTAKRPLLNFGSCDGCPTAVDPTRQPNNGWTVEDVWYVSAGNGAAQALPEIYLHSGISADQWYHLSLYGQTQHGHKIEFAGALTQYAACQIKDPVNCALNGTDNKPEVGLRQLNAAINTDARTAFSATAMSDLTWQQDLTTTAQTRARRAAVPSIAYRATGNGYIVEAVQPPLAASTFIGANAWLGTVNGEAMQVYGGLTRAWGKDGQADARGGLAIFAIQADGTTTLVHILPAPDVGGALHIVRADGNLLVLDQGGRELRFDLASETWQ